MNNVRNYLELTKLKIMIPVSLTGFTGYFIFDPHFSGRIFFITAGILLMAMSASVMNQLQEVDADKKMDRTRNRPLPSGKIKSTQAFFLFVFCLIAGGVIIYLSGSLKAALIALFTVLWYNGVYTNLKKISSFAVVPGAITGALPPLIGWVAAGGDLWDKQILFVEFIFFSGQIPHFWLLLLRYADDYNKAGIPALTSVFSLIQLNRMTFTWIVTSVVAALFLCCFEIIRTVPATMILLMASIYIVWQFRRLLKPELIRNYTKFSLMFDFYFLLIIVLLISDKLII